MNASITWYTHSLNIEKLWRSIINNGQISTRYSDSNHSAICVDIKERNIVKYTIQISELVYNNEKREKRSKENRNKEKVERDVKQKKLCSVVVQAEDDLEAVRAASQLKRKEYSQLIHDSKVLQYQIIQKGCLE